MKQTFNFFNEGKLYNPSLETCFSNLPWNNHPTFEGVALKHLVTAKDTEGAFSYHLVKINPNKQIGLHLHETQLETHEVIAGSGKCINNGIEITYESGCISILPKASLHQVTASQEGLFLFAKFMPALC